jgi:hypothetical protein
MKEVFTKSFRQGVEKIFDQALEDPPTQGRQAVADSGRGRSEPVFNFSDTVAIATERNQRNQGRNHGEPNGTHVRSGSRSVPPGSGAVPLGGPALGCCGN